MTVTKTSKPTHTGNSETKITRSLVINEAIDLLNDEGLEGISLRKLATRLGIKAPSLYWHFPNKQELLAAVIEKIFRQCLEDVPAHKQWRKWMHAFGVSIWNTQNKIRDFGRLVTTTDISEAQLLRTTELIRKAVEEVDIPVTRAFRLQSSIQALMSGWSAFAHAPYAKALSKTLDFKAEAMYDLELLLDGEELRLSKK